MAKDKKRRDKASAPSAADTVPNPIESVVGAVSDAVGAVPERSPVPSSEPPRRLPTPRTPRPVGTALHGPTASRRPSMRACPPRGRS